MNFTLARFAALTPGRTFAQRHLATDSSPVTSPFASTSSVRVIMMLVASRLASGLSMQVILRRNDERWLLMRLYIESSSTYCRWHDFKCFSKLYNALLSATSHCYSVLIVTLGWHKQTFPHLPPSSNQLSIVHGDFVNWISTNRISRFHAVTVQVTLGRKIHEIDRRKIASTAVQRGDPSRHCTVEFATKQVWALYIAVKECHSWCCPRALVSLGTI